MSETTMVGAPVTATGGVLAAPVGTTAPTDSTSALPSPFVKLGLVGEDGVTKTVDATDEKIKAWGGDIVRIVRSEHSVSFSMTFMESANADLLKSIYGEDNVEITPATAESGRKIEIRQTSAMPRRGLYVIDLKDGDASAREVILDGQLTQSGDVNYVHTDLIRYTVTIEAFPVDGVKTITYIDDGTTV